MRVLFKDQIIDVLELGNKKQMLMFSATINKSVFELIKLYMRDPAFVDLTKGQRFKMPTNIEHCIVNSYGKETSDIITHYLKEYNADKCIIFTKTKSKCFLIIILVQRNFIAGIFIFKDKPPS